MATPHPLPAARKLGSYLQCSPRALASALDRQGLAEPRGPRLGEVLLEARAISREDLLASIAAQRADRLRACRLFTGLSPAEVAALAEGVEEISVLAGEQFITQDAPEPYLYILASGRVEVVRSGEHGETLSLSTVLPGEPIGEMGYFSEGGRSASVRALEPSELLRIHYDYLARCFESSSRLAQAFVNVVSERLRRTNRLYQSNEHRLKTTERSLKRLSEFLDLSGAAELGAGIEGLIERLVSTARQITDTERGSLFLVDGATGELWSKVAEGSEVKEIRVPVGSGIAGWVAEHRRVLNIADAYEDPRFNPAVDRRTGYHTRSILCAPIWSLRQEILGVVQVINKRSGAFNDDDEALLRAFAYQAGVAVENFNLYRRMMVSHQRMAIMLDIATSIGNTLDLSQLIRQIVDKTAEVLECERSSLFVLDEPSRELWSMEAHGSELQEIRFPVSIGLAGHVATTGEIVNVADAYQDPRFNPEFDRRSGYRTRSLLGVPVVDREGRIIGVTEAINKSNGDFDADDVDLLRAVASQIGVALENAKLHASTLGMKNYLESVQQSIASAIITLDPDYRVVTLNRAALGLLPAAGGADPERDMRQLLGARNPELLGLLERGYLRRHTVVEYDVELHCPDGEPHTVNVNVLPLKDSDQEFQGLIVVLEDVTSEKRVRSAFNHYLAPAVIEQLLSDPSRLSLGGEKREMTFLFTDIAGFTALSERTDPAALIQLLNAYFDRACGVVLRHGGTIDKIVGDALHVMFNAPIDQADHAERAVRCAIELADLCEVFVAEQARRGVVLGRTRIGVNTGPAVVGNFGGSTRFDYTAYGDAINTAARLEGANQYLGTRICVSKATRDQCRDLLFRPVGHLVLKGKAEPIEAFEPELPGRHSRDRLEEYLRAFRALEQGRANARDAFHDLSLKCPGDRLVAYHATRLANGESGARIVMAGK